MKYIPHDYQARCTAAIISQPSVGLFLDMGLGKSIITLSAVSELLAAGTVRRVLVIAPLKVAESTWSREAAKWSHTKHLRVSLILGSAAKRLQAAQADADVYVINRENTQWLVKQFIKSWRWDMLVVDESTSFKSPSSQRFKSLKKVRTKFKRIVLLTGTPVPNGYMDLWSQVFLLDGGQRLLSSFFWFLKTYFYNITSHLSFPTYELRPEAAAQIESRIADICISLKAADYLSLPELIINDIPVSLSSKAMRVYYELEDEYFAQVGEFGVEAMTAAAASNKLKQTCNGSVYDGEGNVAVVHSDKQAALAEVIEGLGGQHALIFYSYRHDIPHIVQAIKSANKDARISTEVTPTTQDAWNAGEIDYLIAHPASTAFGLNLQQGGNNIIWYGLPWDLELYLQANARLHRQGQTRPVVVHRLIASGTVEEAVALSLAEKTNTADALHNYLASRAFAHTGGNKVRRVS